MIRMNKKYPLSKLLEALEWVDSDNQIFMHKETLKLIAVNDLSLNCLNRYELDPTSLLDWERDLAIEMNDLEYIRPDDYLKLPTQHELNDYLIMERYISTLPTVLKESFYDAISKKGPFKNFRFLLQRHHLNDDFFEFKKKRYEELLIEWCESQGIDYEK